MKTMHKLKALVAIAGAVALTFSAQAATKKVKVGKVTWTLSVSGSSAKVGNGTDCAVSPQPNGALTIPAKIGKFTVKAIGANAFKDCDGLTAVTIPSSVTSIGDYAFSASGLKSVSVPGSVKSVEEHAFYGCTSLKNVTLATGVEKVGVSAFEDCRSIEWVAMPHGLKTMGNYAFRNAWTSEYMGQVYYENADDERFLRGFLDVSNSGTDVAFYLRCKLTVKPNSTKYGTVAVGETAKTSIWKIADRNDVITAKPKKGYVFVGWFMDKACKTPLTTKENGGIIFDPDATYRQKTLAVVMPGRHTTLYAKFITKAADKKALKFSAATKKLAKTPAKFTTGWNSSFKVSASSATVPRTYSAKGLPSGLTIDKATGEISGEPTKPGTFTATVTVKSGGGSTLSQKVKITVYLDSWARGAYEGVALPGTKASDPPAHLTFSAGSTGKVSGKVNYKGKAYPFTAKCSYCYGGYMRFTPSVKIGKTTFKPGMVTVTRDVLDGRDRPVARCDSERFLAYKSYNLVKAGGTAAVYVGYPFRLYGDNDVSGLPPGKVDLRAELLSGDRVRLSGKVNGKKLSMTTQMSLKKTSVDNNTFDTTYEMYADIIFPGAKYYRALKLTFVLFGSGDEEGSVLFFAPEIHSIDAMWE